MCQPGTEVQHAGGYDPALNQVSLQLFEFGFLILYPFFSYVMQGANICHSSVNSSIDKTCRNAGSGECGAGRRRI